MYLDLCYRGVVDYHDRPRVNPDGTVAPRELPPSMKEPVCPQGKTIKTLSGEPAAFDPQMFEKGGKAEILKTVGFVIEELSYACYQYTRDEVGKGFTCHAWTDIDDDGQPAHWVKKAIFEEAVDGFRAGPTLQERPSDDW